MAISVDTVYQRVLAIANKEQRGYITPQEFNLFARQAQMQIFEQYFYDLNQFKRVKGNQSDFADMKGVIEDKLSIFLDDTGVGTASTLPSDFYRIHSLASLNNSTNARYLVEIVEKRKAIDLQSSGPLTRPTANRPIAYLDDNRLFIFPAANGYSRAMSYYRAPESPRWSYVVVNNKPLYNGSSSIHFELHESEEYDLILKILQMAGIAIKEFSLTQAAGQAEVNIVSQQKQ